MVLKINIYKVFLLLIIAGMIFTDLPIGKYTVMHSPMFIIAPIVLFIILILNKFKISFHKATILKAYYFYLFVAFLSSMIMVSLAIFKNGSIIVYDKNIIIKFFESFFSLPLLHFIVFYLLVICFFKINGDKINKIFFIVAIFLILCGLLELFYPEALYFIHIDKYEYNRLRITSAESSHAVLNFSIFILMYLITETSNIKKLIVLLLSFFIFIKIGSKGAFISLFFAFVIAILLNSKNYKIALILLIPFLVAMFHIVKFVIPAIVIDINNFTSFSTRLTALMSIFYILIFYPIGTGYGSYLYFFPGILISSYNGINSIFKAIFNVNINFNEINEMVTTGINVGAKAAVPQFVMFSGWFGLLFLFAIFYTSFKYLKYLKEKEKIKDLILFRFMLLFLIFQLFIGSECTLIYSIWLPFAYLEAQMKKLST